MRRLITGFVVLLAAAPTAYAGPGDLDRTFSRNGRVGFDPYRTGGTVAGLTLVDGVRPVLTVNAYRPGGHSTPTWLSLTSRGRVADRVVVPQPGFVTRVVSGWTMAVGDYERTNPVVLTRVLTGETRTLRLPDGMGATTFAFDARGRILVGGWVAKGNGRYAVVTRLKANGAPDPSYAFARLRALEAAFRLLPRPDGGVYVSDDAKLGRLTPTGRLQPGFRQGRSFIPRRDGRNGSGHQLVRGPGETVLIAGNGYPTGPWIARLRADGRLDRRFGRAGRITGGDTLRGLDFAALAVDGRGRVVAVGGSGSGVPDRAAVVRFSARGRVDRSFGERGRKTFKLATIPRKSIIGSSLEHVAIDERGRIVVAGNVYDDEYELRDDVGQPYPAIARLQG